MAGYRSTAQRFNFLGSTDKSDPHVCKISIGSHRTDRSGGTAVNNRSAVHKYLLDRRSQFSGLVVFLQLFLCGIKPENFHPAHISVISELPEIQVYPGLDTTGKKEAHDKDIFHGVYILNY